MKNKTIMNSKQVLDKILTMLSLKQSVNFTYAKLADGTIVESPTFDVGEALDVVSEDGTKTPAPNGEHELALKDSEGKDVLIKVKTEEGKIVERANIELPASEEAKVEEEMKAETIKTEPLPGDPSIKKDEKMAEVEPLPTGDGVEESVDPLPGEDEVIDMKKMYEDMAYRIEEMEKKIAKMEAAEVEIEVEKEEEEVKVPKLDGAPIEEAKFSAINKQKDRNKVGNTQDSFLSKLYN
jgi:hypothetical protein